MTAMMDAQAASAFSSSRSRPISSAMSCIRSLSSLRSPSYRSWKYVFPGLFSVTDSADRVTKVRTTLGRLAFNSAVSTKWRNACAPLGRCPWSNSATSLESRFLSTASSSPRFDPK